MPSREVTVEPKLFEIKHRLFGKVLFSLETKSLKLCVEAAVEVGASLDGANLDGANLDRARLVGASLDRASLDRASLDGASLVGASLDGASLDRASLDGASLVGASLDGASLDRASLVGASLVGARLDRASLVGARGISKYQTTNLYFLKDQIGKIRAYKLVNDKNEGPYNGGIVYEIGKTVSVKDADCDETAQCSRGISLADLPWCLKEWKEGYKILVAEFTAKNIAAIPIGSDGKFRVSCCKIVGEKDLKELGLIK